jgi:N-acetylglucosaminyldiphosphoundecaprenol N-acetyl-beta-D-mannosaminyltransferase
MKFASVNILGFPVARLSMAQVIDHIATEITTHGDHSDKTFHIVTANAEILYRAFADPALGQLLLQADLITPDGNGTVQAAQKLGHPVPERVTGVDLMDQLLHKAEKEGWRIYFLGAAEAVITATVDVVKKRWPKLEIAGWRNGYFSAAERPTIIEGILNSGADILFVALGFPAQDQIIVEMTQAYVAGSTTDSGAEAAEDVVEDVAADAKEAVDKNVIRHLPAVSIGVGGSFDAISGNVKRAPQWIQNIGMEWAYRFAQNPKRLKRASALPKFVLAVRKQVKRERNQ